MRTLTTAFSSSFRRGFPLLSPWCYQKMHYFCLAAKNDFLSLHLHFWLFFSPIFLGTFPTFQQTTLLLFLRDFWFAEPFRRIALKNGDECTQVAKFRFDRRPHDSFQTGKRANSARLLAEF
uniref:(northern house mosquito) hypothetical protein n=1 Tax=Culex pipiens TaxID=7175 RepID=A0A8D8PFC0_CULPI